MTAIGEWHFVAMDRTLGYGDGRLVEAGKTYCIDDAPVLCKRGLHACPRALDALRYAPGLVICRVILGGEIVGDGEKHAGTRRTVLWMADASAAVVEFARHCASFARERAAEASAAAAAEAAAAWAAARAAAAAAARDELNAALERRLWELAPEGARLLEVR